MENLRPELPDIDPLRRSRARLIARAEDADIRFEQETLTVGHSKARIEDEPEVMAVLEALQAREHQRAVGDYEQLLTLLLNDVLPGERNVVLDLRTERGLPALDVFLRKGEGQPLEDALHGTGGSVTNLLSAGLRFIALARSGLRPFLVLDEADCWIKPALAARFAGVVQQMAEELGVQVLMISHHDDSLFEPVLPHRLRLEVGSQGLTAHWAPTSDAPTWREDQSGIRSIELINFQSHKHTVLPMSPGVTLLQGDNDIGKSAVAKALRAVFYAESNETFIKHGAAKSRVILDFGPENVLSWERHRKGKVTVAYALNDRNDGSLLHHSEGARVVPPWVSQFKIEMADDLDIQLGNQQDPVFLLNKRPSERAKALAVGDDAGYVQTLLALDKQDLSDARATVRQGEKSLENLYRIRAALEPIKQGQGRWDLIEELRKTILQAREKFKTQEALGLRWMQAHEQRQALSVITEGKTPAMPALVTDPGLRGLFQRWQSAQRQQQALEGISVPGTTLPAAPSSEAKKPLLARWIEARARSQALGSLVGTAFPQLPEVDRTRERAGAILLQWRRAQQQVQILSGIGEKPKLEEPALGSKREALLHERWVAARKDTELAAGAVATARQEEANIETTLAQEFTQCPLCHHPLSEEHQHA